LSYLFFLAVLLLAAAIAGLLRLFRFRHTFDPTFKVIATAVVFAPIVIWSFIMCAAFAVGIGGVAWGIVRATGLFPTVSSGPFWPWLTLGGAVVIAWLVIANRR
jgi:hypothetical protein